MCYYTMNLKKRQSESGSKRSDWWSHGGVGVAEGSTGTRKGLRRALGSHPAELLVWAHAVKIHQFMFFSVGLFYFSKGSCAYSKGKIQKFYRHGKYL